LRSACCFSLAGCFYLGGPDMATAISLCIGEKYANARFFPYAIDIAQVFVRFGQALNAFGYGNPVLIDHAATRF